MFDIMDENDGDFDKVCLYKFAFITQSKWPMPRISYITFNSNL